MLNSQRFGRFLRNLVACCAKLRHFFNYHTVPLLPVFTAIFHNVVLSCKPTEFFKSSTVIAVPTKHWVTICLASVIMKPSNRLFCPIARLCTKLIGKHALSPESPESPGACLHIWVQYSTQPFLSIEMYKMFCIIHHPAVCVESIMSVINALSLLHVKCIHYMYIY